MESPVRQIGYVELLRGNSQFRRLFTGQLISQTGDWFNSVALFTLLLELTGSNEAVGLVLIIKLLPTFFAGPAAGVVADRFNRKRIMITADVICACVVLGFLLVRRPDQVWLAYVLAATEILTASFFEPAKSAAIPGLVSEAGLIAANALSSASWSVTVALGAALGGLVTAGLGRDAAFIIDSISFLVSAVFIATLKLDQKAGRKPESSPSRRVSIGHVTGFNDFAEGAHYVKSNPSVATLLLVKSGWGLGGGVLLLLTVFGKSIFPIGREGSASIGLLYAARGTGALLGPILASRMAAPSPKAMKGTITFAFLLSSAFYLLFASASSLPLAILCVIGAHAGGSIQWVYSTTLLQVSAENRFLGRVFALDMALVTLSMSLSTYLTGYGLDHAGISARGMATILGFVFIVPAVVWFLIQRGSAKGEDSARTGRASRDGVPPETSFPPP
jgi:predicted MFS family arabinose efflux permease